MVTESAKKPAAKKPAEKKVAAKKAEEAPAADKKFPKVAPSVGKVKITQLVGTIGRRRDQEATLIGLGLNKRHRSKVLSDTPAVRGMIYKVRHLVKVEQA